MSKKSLVMTSGMKFDQSLRNEMAIVASRPAHAELKSAIRMSPPSKLTEISSFEVCEVMSFLSSQFHEMHCCMQEKTKTKTVRKKLQQ